MSVAASNQSRFPRPLVKLADEARLASLTKRLGGALILLVVAFGAYYAFDRYFVPVESPLDQSVRQLEDAVRKQPNDPELRVMVGNGYVRQGRLDKAVIQYQEALKLKEDWQPALLAMAATELEQRNEARAEEIYRRVADLNQDNELRYSLPDLGLAYYRLASLTEKRGQHAEAAAWAGEALKVDRTDADALLLLGQAEEGQAHLEHAVDAYRRAAAFDPNFREAFAGLERVASRSGNSREAAYAKSMGLLAGGDVAAALAGFQRLVQDDPDYAEGYQGLGLAYGRRGQIDESQRAFRAALERDPNLTLAQWSLRPDIQGSR